jgi:hypothetical protein
VKAHLLDSDAPIIEGSTVTANCGKKIKKVKFVMMWDAQQMGTEILIDAYVNVCLKCMKRDWEQSYIYGIVEF